MVWRLRSSIFLVQKLDFGISWCELKASFFLAQKLDFGISWHDSEALIFDLPGKEVRL